MSQSPLSEPRRYTVEEYLRIDSGSEIRHEYVGGQVIDMAGGSDAHSKIIHNLHGVLWTHLRGKPCEARDGNLRVRYGRKVRFGYPDALIFCGEPQFDPFAGGNTTLLNPRVLIEVLSETTEAYDRGRKFEYYRDIDSFEEYVLISQDRPSVEVWRRQPTGFWMMQPYQGTAANAALLTVGVELPLSELYFGVPFPPEKPDELDTVK
jgi:Uma2 family endonuclease